MRRPMTGLLVLWLLLVTPAPAHAYVDPTSGSMIVQAILGGLAGLLVLVKILWRRIMGWFKGDSHPSRNE